MRKIILLLAVITMLFSCKTSKTTLSEKTSTETEQRNDIQEVINTEFSVLETGKTTDKTVVEASEDTEITITKFSQPDSTGKQHIVEQTKIKQQKGSTTKTNVATEKEDKTDIKQSVKNKDNSTVKTNNDTKVTETEKTKANTPAWIILGTIILSLGIIVIIYFVLKRFGLVK